MPYRNGASQTMTVAHRYNSLTIKEATVSELIMIEE